MNERTTEEIGQVQAVDLEGLEFTAENWKLIVNEIERWNRQVFSRPDAWVDFTWAEAVECLSHFKLQPLARNLGIVDREGWRVSFYIRPKETDRTIGAVIGDSYQVKAESCAVVISRPPTGEEGDCPFKFALIEDLPRSVRKGVGRELKKIQDTASLKTRAILGESCPADLDARLGNLGVEKRTHPEGWRKVVSPSGTVRFKPPLGEKPLKAKR